MINPKVANLKRNNPELFEDEDDTALRIGSAVDCLLTSPERWDDDFVVGDVFKPFGLMFKFVKNLPKGLTIDSPLEDYKEAYDKAGYKKSVAWVVDQFLSNEKHVEYYLWLTQLDDNKIALSKDEYSQVRKCVSTISSNEFTLPYFVNLGNNIDLLHQVAIYFDYELDGEVSEAKALLDGILVNHTNKTIQPFDLKTTGKSVWEFSSSYLHFGYYRQCALYELALYSKDSPVKEWIDKGYEVLDFIFIVVESKSDAHNPAMIYRTSLSDRLCGIEGCSLGSKYYPGINDLLRAYRWHSSQDYWELPKDVFENNGEAPLSIFR